jgi:hypothetical protein
MNDVVDRPEDLTAAWLSEALSASGHDLAVESVKFERIGTGQMGTTYRLHLTYQGSEGPPTLVAKLAGEDEAVRELVAPGYAAEVGFYTALAPSLSVRTPRCWYGAITTDKTCFTLLLDDISSAVPGLQVEGCTVAQASASLGNLIGLHAPRWSDPSLWDLEFLLRPDEAMAAMLAQVMSMATDTFVERYAGQLSDVEGRILRDTSAVIEQWQLARPTPFSVIHGDYRLDNLMFDLSTGEVTAVDWQTAAIGPPLRDVAYLLGTSLHSEDRRATEASLVREYHSALVDRGIDDYDADQCWDDYRLGQLQGPMITVIGCIYAAADRSEKSDAMFLAMARRSCAAIRELGSLDLV